MTKHDPEEAIDLANSILIDWDKKKIDPGLAYAALGCAFQQLHQGLGKDKKEWLKTTKDMAKLTNWKKNDT